LYPNEEDEDRQIYSAMVTQMDDIVGNLTDTLKERSMYENSIVVLIGDNGGMVSGVAPICRPLKKGNCSLTHDFFSFQERPLFGIPGGGSNDPLRSEKGTIYEGGTRTPGFIHSPLIKNKG